MWQLTQMERRQKHQILLMDKILEKIKVEVARKNIQLVIVVQPSLYDFLTDNAIMSRKDLSQYEKYNYKNLTDPIKAICSSLRLHCVHLIDEFLKNNPETLYLKKDNHWSDKGQELSARIASEYIIINMLQH